MFRRKFVVLQSLAMSFICHITYNSIWWKDRYCCYMIIIVPMFNAICPLYSFVWCCLWN